jgi:hypothetical protein
MRHVNLKIFVFFILVFVSAAGVVAIGISPADAYITFTPNQEYVIDYSINSYRPFDFYTEGSFSEFTRVETVEHTDSSGHFRVYITLPAEYETPGKHRMFVAAKERPSAGTVNALAAIRGFIEIEVPFPGYYATLDISVSDVNTGEPVIISVAVANKGKLNITDAKVRMSVLSEEKEVKSMRGGPVAIDTGSSYTFSSTIPGNELKPGRYRLKVLLEYEGLSREKAVDFRVGTFDVAIVNYTRSLLNNTVNLFEIEVESLWNNPMSTVYMDLSIKNGSGVLSAVKTPPFDLPPWKSHTSSLYWNTEGIPIGSYDLEVVLHYDRETRTENRKIYIVEKVGVIEEKPVTVSTVVLIITAILLVLFNIYFIISRREKDKLKEDKGK